MTKKHPEGETPAEAIERIAPQPARVTFALNASGDTVDATGVGPAFEAFIRALRATGLNPSGNFHFVIPAHRIDGELVGERIVNLNPADVEEVDEE